MSYRPAELCDGEVPSHRTAAGVLIRDGKVLLEQRDPDAAVYPDCWDIPGGHVEAAEQPEDAVRREMREELGIEVGALSLCAVQDDRENRSGRLYRHFNFLVLEYAGEITPREEQTLRWWSLDDAIRSEVLNPLSRWVLEVCVDQGWVG